MTTRLMRFALPAVLVLAAATLPAGAATTTRPAYGCFKVSAPKAAIRDRASDKGNVLKQAAKGDVLIKLKRFCSLSSRWCSVSAGGTTGWVEKSATKVAPCPASTAQPKT